MSEDLSDIPEDLGEYLEQFPPAEESIRELEAMKIDLEAEPIFVSEFLKGLFVNDLLTAMQDDGVSRSELAKRLGESRQYVSKLLKDQSNFTIDTMAKLACALGLRLFIKLHRPDERVELRKIPRKQNVVTLRKSAPQKRQRANVGEEPVVYEGGRKPKKASASQERAGRGKTPRAG